MEGSKEKPRSRGDGGLRTNRNDAWRAEMAIRGNTGNGCCFEGIFAGLRRVLSFLLNAGFLAFFKGPSAVWFMGARQVGEGTFMVEGCKASG